MSSTPARLPRVTLRADAIRRLARGHRWVFSNEIDSRDAEVTDGSAVAVFSSRNEFLGCGLHSAHALIAVRLYSSRSAEFDEAFVTSALDAAVARRRHLDDRREAWRVVFSESDGLPGLVVDRYGPVLVMQLLTAPMDQRRAVIVSALRARLAPQAIVERSDSPARALENLPPVTGIVEGTLPDGLSVVQDGLRFPVDVLAGQKTGLFLDQCENWLMARRHATGARVLDLFCHAGGWSLNALRGGATGVVSVDASAGALASLRGAVEANGLASGSVETVEADVFEFLRGRGDERFGMVVCDPPAFAKNRKAADAALRGYRDVNRLAMRRLEPGGVMVTCSCSHHIGRDDFMEMLRLAARDAGR